MKPQKKKVAKATKEIKIVEGDVSVPSRFPDASLLCKTSVKAGLLRAGDPGTCPY